MKIWIFDCNPNNRGAFLGNVVKENGVEAESHIQVWDERKHNSIPEWKDCQDDFPVEEGDMIFIHAQDAQQRYWKNFVHKWKDRAWIVLYSGGGLKKIAFEQEFRRKESKICIYELPVPDNAKAAWNIKIFIHCVQSGLPNCCDRLIGYDPRLEEKLILLHLCLTPEGKGLAAELFENINGLDEGTLKYKRSLQQTFAKLITFMQDEQDCFSLEYLSALKDLRENLDLATSKEIS